MILDQVLRQGSDHIGKQNSRRTRENQMETLQSHRSRRNQNRHSNNPNVANFHRLRYHNFHRKHLLSRASKPHEPQAWTFKPPSPNPPDVLRLFKISIRQIILHFNKKPQQSRTQTLRSPNWHCSINGIRDPNLHYCCKSGNAKAKCD